MPECDKSMTINFPRNQVFFFKLRSLTLAPKCQSKSQLIFNVINQTLPSASARVPVKLITKPFRIYNFE